jgi:hypothetical protein
VYYYILASLNSCDGRNGMVGREMGNKSGDRMYVKCSKVVVVVVVVVSAQSGYERCAWDGNLYLYLKVDNRLDNLHVDV